MNAVRKIPANIPRVTAAIIMKLLSLFRHKFRHANEGIILVDLILTMKSFIYFKPAYI
jgi:hypothetical protein